MSEPRRDCLLPGGGEAWHGEPSVRKISLFGISVHSLLGWRCLLCVLDVFVCGFSFRGKTFKARFEIFVLRLQKISFSNETMIGSTL